MMRFYVLLLSIFLLSSSVYAGEVILNNGDKISGRILERSSKQVVVETQALGTITVKGEFVKSVTGFNDAEDVKKTINDVKPEIKKKASAWKGKWSIGGFQQGGNTRKKRLKYSLKLNKKNPTNEWTIEAKSSYASQTRKMNEQKHYGMMRYGYQLHEGSPWYFFGKLEADHARFSNIDYRLVPAYGGGYWFSDTADLKMLTDGALGYQYTAYRDNTKNEGEWVWIPRFYLDKKLMADLRLTQEVTFYPSLEDMQSYRVRSETSLVQPITDKVSWKLTLSDDFNSRPRGSSKKNDYSLTAGIDVAF